MDRCPVLPAADGNIGVIVMAAAIVTGVGVIAVVLARRRMMHVLVAMLVSLVVAVGIPAHAAKDCSPLPIAATLSPTTTSTSPTTTSTSPTTTTTTTSPTTSTTTTVATTAIPTSATSPTPSPDPGSAPIAEDDGPLLVAVGERVNLNVLANDDLGTPQATITAHSFDAAQVGCRGLSFDSATGLLSGTAAAGACIFSYTVSNWARDHATVTLLIS